MSDHVSFEITAEQVNAYISRAVLQSTLGDAVKAAIDRNIADMSKSYDNPFDHAIKNQIASMVAAAIRTDFAPRIKVEVEKALAARLTEQVLGNLVMAAVDSATKRY